MPHDLTLKCWRCGTEETYICRGKRGHHGHEYEPTYECEQCQRTKWCEWCGERPAGVDVEIVYTDIKGQTQRYVDHLCAKCAKKEQEDGVDAASGR